MKGDKTPEREPKEKEIEGIWPSRNLPDRNSKGSKPVLFSLIYFN